jgi:hypothetical protein
MKKNWPPKKNPRVIKKQIKKIRLATYSLIEKAINHKTKIQIVRLLIDLVKQNLHKIQLKIVTLKRRNHKQIIVTKKKKKKKKEVKIIIFKLGILEIILKIKIYYNNMMNLNNRNKRTQFYCKKRKKWFIFNN